MSPQKRHCSMYIAGVGSTLQSAGEVEHKIVINPYDIAVGRVSILVYRPSAVGNIAATYVEPLCGAVIGRHADADQGTPYEDIVFYRLTYDFAWPMDSTDRVEYALLGITNTPIDS